MTVLFDCMLVLSVPFVDDRRDRSNPVPLNTASAATIVTVRVSMVRVNVRAMARF